MKQPPSVPLPRSPEATGARPIVGHTRCSRAAAACAVLLASLGLSPPVEARPAPILLDRLVLSDEGDAVRISAMAARIPMDTLAVLLGAGATALEDVRLEPSGPDQVTLKARALGLPLEVGCGLWAESGRLVLTLDAVKFAMLPVGGAWIRDRIVQAADPDLFRRDLWRKRGPNGLSINPSYLLGWAIANRRTPSGRTVGGHPLRVDLGALALSPGHVSIRVP
ncbi:MAG: hypothetical protein FJY99_02995 [Candidatus Sericytochromatia bacterium]|nr:hypothetical protein [Candidatus Tanganyikabacteria bacterium]